MLRYAAENDEDEDVHAIHTYIYVSCTTKIVKIQKNKKQYNL